MSDSTAPYLSVVVTTRNDDHGRNPLGRFQAFVNSLVAQCRRVQLPSELIVVEWNPPEDRPPLRDALAWPADTSPCDVRIIQVPAELHRTLKHHEALPLFQMIAKNVGIRRARGQFVLSSNIDILLSNELVDYIAGGRLQAGVMYRVDRHDVDEHLPVAGSLDEMMAYCRTHQLRKHTRWGSFPIDSAGGPALYEPDIVDARSGIRLGEGWHVREGSGAETYRWASECADVIVDSVAGSGRLNVEVESNPFDSRPSIDVSISDAEAGVLCSGSAITGRVVLRLAVPQNGGPRRLRIESRSSPDIRETLPVYEDRDQLTCRVPRIWWDTGDLPDPRPSDSRYPLDRWKASAGGGAEVEVRPDGVSVVTGARHLIYAAEYGPMVAPARGTYRFWITAAIEEGRVTVQVLSGDQVRFLPCVSQSLYGGPGVQIFSVTLELDAGQGFFLVLSNYRPEGNERSRLVIRDLRGDCPWEQCVADAAMRAEPPAIEPVTVHRASSAGLIRRIAGRLRPRDDAPAAAPREVVIDRIAPPPDYADLVAARSRLAPLEPLRALLGAIRPDRLHTNACGDFQLMSRDDWFELRGFAELELYSMNIDCLFAHTAHYGGVREHVFMAPGCVYHIEHEIGSGWTPEGEARLRQRILDRGIGWLDNAVVQMLASFMKWVNRPMILNRSDWGFGRHELPETAPGRDNATRSVSR